MDLSRLIAPWLQTLGAETLGAKTPGARPNIVLVMVDDMGYSDIGCFGAEIQKTLVGQWKTWADQVQFEARPANLVIPPAVPE